MADPACRDVVELLLDYLEEGLALDTRAALEQHFQKCAACVAYLRTYERSRWLARNVARPDAPAELPEHLRTRLRQLLLRRLRAQRS
jgi:anti-sigma factor RsiW